jgi:hypothetical protein
MAADGQGPQVLGRFADVRQAERDVGEEALAGFGQPDLAVAALEQRHAELGFERAHRVGYGGLGHAELAAGGGEARQPAGGLEDD